LIRVGRRTAGMSPVDRAAIGIILVTGFYYQPTFSYSHLTVRINVPQNDGELMKRPDRSAPLLSPPPLRRRLIALLVPGRILFSFFLLALPIAYDTRDSSGVGFEFGAYGGTGQFATVFRGCNGDVLEKYKNDYDDYAGFGEASIPLSGSDRIAVGVRGGQLRLNAPVHTTRHSYFDTVGTDRIYGYVNPYVSYDRPKFGIGVGYVTGHVPLETNSSESDDAELHATGHLRLGTTTGPAYFLLSVGENTPLVSGGG